MASSKELPEKISDKKGSHSKCCVIGCGHKRHVNTNCRPFFSFPVKDEERCRKWVQYTGNMDIYHSHISKIDRRILCKCHFSAEQFIPPRCIKLKSDAIPDVSLEYSKPLSDETMADWPSEISSKPVFMAYTEKTKTEEGNVTTKTTGFVYHVLSIDDRTEEELCSDVYREIKKNDAKAKVLQRKKVDTPLILGEIDPQQQRLKVDIFNQNQVQKSMTFQTSNIARNCAKIPIENSFNSLSPASHNASVNCLEAKDSTNVLLPAAVNIIKNWDSSRVKNSINVALNSPKSVIESSNGPGANDDINELPAPESIIKSSNYPEAEEVDNDLLPFPESIIESPNSQGAEIGLDVPSPATSSVEINYEYSQTEDCLNGLLSSSSENLTMEGAIKRTLTVNIDKTKYYLLQKYNLLDVPAEHLVERLLDVADYQKSEIKKLRKEIDRRNQN